MASSVILLRSWSLERRYVGVSSKHSSPGRTSAVRPIFRIAQDRTKLLITCTSSYPGRDRQNQKVMLNWASLPETRLDVDLVEALKVRAKAGPATVPSAFPRVVIRLAMSVEGTGQQCGVLLVQRQQPGNAK